MRELQEGQKTALDIIMDRWELPIKAYIYRLTQSPDWVDELSQETFVKVYTNAASFNIERRFSPWIYSIATNLCRNWRRWRNRHPSLSQSNPSPETDASELLNNLQDPSETIIEKVESNEHREELKQAIASLPDHLKSTLILYYYQNLSYLEIAEAQNCSIRGVETRLYRAKKQLLARLARTIHM